MKEGMYKDRLFDLFERYDDGDPKDLNMWDYEDAVFVSPRWVVQIGDEKIYVDLLANICIDTFEDLVRQEFKMDEHAYEDWFCDHFYSYYDRFDAYVDEVMIEIEKELREEIVELLEDDHREIVVNCTDNAAYFRHTAVDFTPADAWNHDPGDDEEAEDEIVDCLELMCFDAAMKINGRLVGHTDEEYERLYDIREKFEQLYQSWDYIYDHFDKLAEIVNLRVGPEATDAWFRWGVHYNLCYESYPSEGYDFWEGSLTYWLQNNGLIDPDELDPESVKDFLEEVDSDPSVPEITLDMIPTLIDKMHLCKIWAEDYAFMSEVVKKNEEEEEMPMYYS